MRKTGQRKTRQGMVVSDRMDKTVVVEVVRRVKHPLFKKYVSKSKKFKAHDPQNDCGIGDEIIVEEIRPLSRTKHWRVKQILKKAL